MNPVIFKWLIVFLCCLRSYPVDATFRCGVQRISFGPRMQFSWLADERQWPWHVGLFHKTLGATQKYACGATLLDEKHVLTSAHCVFNPNTNYPLPASSLVLHFGQLNISRIDDHVQVRSVREVHVHPEHSTHINDIAVLVMKSPVQYSDFVIPICLDRQVKEDLSNLEGQRVWVAGWGTTEGGVISEELRTTSMPVVSYLECFDDYHVLFRNLLSGNVFCAGDRNGTSPGTGDSGGGMYFLDGDRWVIRGVVSFAIADENWAEADTFKFIMFVHVQRFLGWIRNIMKQSDLAAVEHSKTISVIACDKYKKLIKKRFAGSCANARYPHAVTLLNSDGEAKCMGVLVNENHVLTACHCLGEHQKQRPTKVGIDTYGIVRILESKCHPEFNDEYLYHDLAVIKLSTVVELSSNLVPACLANPWTEDLQTPLLQTGYGKGIFTGVQKFIDTDENQIITKKQCDQLSSIYKRAPIGTISAQLCAINSGRVRFSNVALPGTPLQSVNSDACLYTVVGVTSSGNFGPNLTSIDVYTRIAHHIDWIEQIVWKETQQRPVNVGRSRKFT